jgi:hypothetical protein
MIRDTLAHHLEQHLGFRRLGADETDPVKAHASLVLERHDLPGAPADVVLLVDRTDPEALPGDAAAPHRSPRGLAGFSMPAADVVRFVEAMKLRRTFMNPLRRVTIVEVGDGPSTAEDQARLESYRSPARGSTWVAAVYLDATARTVWSNDTAASEGLPQCEDPGRWVAQAVGGTLAERPFTLSRRLFGPKAVALTAFFGSPLAGASLLAWNLHKTRRTKVALALLGATSVALAVVIALPTGQQAGFAVGAIVNFAFMFALASATGKLFGDPLRKPAVGFAVLATIASWVLIIGGVVAGSVGWEMATVTTVHTQGGAEVQVERGASVEEGKMLGATLDAHKVLGPGSDVRFSKTETARVLSLALVTPGQEKNPDTRAFYQHLAQTLSTELFHGEPVEIVFLDKWGEREDSLRSP